MSTDIRLPKKAGSWYIANPASLSSQLERNLDGVSVDKIAGCQTLPIPGARIIIAPHAGYEYSGECAAWAYRCLDLSKAKRVFILGPSHVMYLAGCAVTQYHRYGTPFGELMVDEEVVAALRAAKISRMDRRADQQEHSLEMHLPYLYKRLEQTFGSADKFPSVVPMVVGNLKSQAEKEMGALLAPYVRDPENAFIVSSDFCHWGDNFGFSPYSATNDVHNLRLLRGADGPQPDGPTVEDTIELMDRHALDAIGTGSHDKFVESLRTTKNTVCGRHPIGVIMAALEMVGANRAEAGTTSGGGEGEGKGEIYRFRELKYTTSGKVKNDAPIEDSSGHSVSYVSAYALA